jgi:uncharacterized Fe-S cluster protein YjdI
MHNKSHTYSRDGITILWQPDICIHSGVCVHGLSEVFNPRKHPWIDLDKAEMDLIAEQVKKCPSGALSILKE